MPLYRYTFRQGGYERSLLFRTAHEAGYSVVSDLHDREAEPISVAKDGKRLWGPAEMQRLYAACRADLERDPWQVPAVLERPKCSVPLADCPAERCQGA